MKALVIPRLAGPEVLELQQVPLPQPGPKETLVKVEAGGVNFADILTSSGGYPGMPQLPFVAGREFAGTMKDTGQRVMGYTQWGAFAEYLAVHRSLLWPVPDHWTASEAAAFPVNYFTAYFAYWKAGLLQNSGSGGPGRVLIHAVAGGVGTAAVEIGKILGLEMYGTSSSDEKLAKVKELGLQHAINYKEHDYEEAIKELTNGEGVDSVFEMLGGEHPQKSSRCLRDFGTVIVYGAASGLPGQVDPRSLFAKGTSVHGLWLSQLSRKQDLMTSAWKQLSLWIAERKLHPVVGHILPLEKAIAAYRLLLDRQNYGKVVLTI
jgi:NADPH:quinone reductase